MHSEPTLLDIFEEIADQLALARTKALLGEPCEALGIFQAASLEYTRFRDVLSGCPGFHSLEHAFAVTMTALQVNQARNDPGEAASAGQPPAPGRRRGSRAA